MAMMIQRAIALLYTAVQQLIGKEVGADELFPVIVIAVLHCNIPDIHHYIKFLNDFLSHTERFGEVGYSLITLDGTTRLISSNSTVAAVVHITEEL